MSAEVLFKQGVSPALSHPQVLWGMCGLGIRDAAGIWHASFWCRDVVRHRAGDDPTRGLLLKKRGRAAVDNCSACFMPSTKFQGGYAANLPSARYEYPPVPGLFYRPVSATVEAVAALVTHGDGVFMRLATLHELPTEPGPWTRRARALCDGAVFHTSLDCIRNGLPRFPDMVFVTRGEAKAVGAVRCAACTEMANPRRARARPPPVAVGVGRERRAVLDSASSEDAEDEGVGSARRKRPSFVPVRMGPRPTPKGARLPESDSEAEFMPELGTPRLRATVPGKGVPLRHDRVVLSDSDSDEPTRQAKPAAAMAPPRELRISYDDGDTDPEEGPAPPKWRIVADDGSSSDSDAPPRPSPPPRASRVHGVMSQRLPQTRPLIVASPFTGSTRGIAPTPPGAGAGIHRRVGLQTLIVAPPVPAKWSAKDITPVEFLMRVFRDINGTPIVGVLFGHGFRAMGFPEEELPHTAALLAKRLASLDKIPQFFIHTPTAVTSLLQYDADV